MKHEQIDIVYAKKLQNLQYIDLRLDLLIHELINIKDVVSITWFRRMSNAKMNSLSPCIKD